MQNLSPTHQTWHGTTILSVRKGERVVIAGDGQVSLGEILGRIQLQYPN